MKLWKRLICALLAGLMVLCGVPSLAEFSQTDEILAIDENAKIYTHDGRVTFVEGKCTYFPIYSEADAAAVVDDMIPLLGGDERTDFEFWRTLTDTNGNHYYVFQQMYADVTVSGGAVKVVTDAEGNMLGLVSSVETELPDTKAAEGITAWAAEDIVEKHLRETQKMEAELVAGRTEKVILPVNLELDIESEEEKEESRFVWAVYTTNPGGSVTSGSDLPYLAHYVTMEGEYLYSLPTIMPGDEAATTGFDAAYVFEFMEPAEYTGTVTWSDGSKHEITVELMRDSRTGMYYMGNIERRIAVADCWEVLYNNGRIVLEASKDNSGWDETTLLSMYNYCRAWDYYNAIGWKGGDGLGTPILVLKDFCYEDHTPVDNAAYAGQYYGWQIFLSSSGNDLAQCLDVLGHEFTHCVTHSVMTYNAYKNDYGAINEAISDIQGNICEMLAGDTDDTTWEMGEHSATPIRNMSNPKKYNQPEYTWDLYYKSHVKDPTDLNDRGGVHTNSSLLNNLAYRLCAEGGMTLEEARAFWFAVDCAMVPGTDYVQLSELMPWVLKLLGMEKYTDALNAAIEATKLNSDAMPESFAEDRALVTLNLPESEMFDDGNWSLMVLSVDLDGLIQRGTDIFFRKEGYEHALDELFDVVNQAMAESDMAEMPAEPEEPDAFDSLLDMLFPPEEKAEEPAEVKAEVTEATAEQPQESWFQRYLGDVIFFDSGAAGQDGRSIRMVSRPGETLPMLLHLKINMFENAPKSVGLAVYTLGRWYDLGSILQKLIEGGEDALIGKDGEDGVADELYKAALPGIQNPAKLREMLLTEIKGGETCEIPAEGLEDVTIIEGEALENLIQTVLEAQETEPAA